MMFSRFISRMSERLVTLYEHISCQIPLLRPYRVGSEKNSLQFQILRTVRSERGAS
jgi:hypothetical protein